MPELKGSWPGGPSRRDAGSDRQGAPGDGERSRPRLPSVGEQTERAAAVRRRSRAQRRRRLHIGIALGAAAVALIGGYFLGLQAHTSTEELTAERMEAYRGQQQSEGLEGLMSRESNRVIQQMWLTELLEGGGR